MKTIQPFIDLGWYCVPWKGKITRGPNGKKVVPPAGLKWQEECITKRYDPSEYNGVAPATGAVITGPLSGIVSVDCDNEFTYELFRKLDPYYDFVFISRDKPEGGASIIYRFDERLAKLKPFRIHDSVSGIQLDFQSNELLQFLPSAGNESKVEWEAETVQDLPLLKEMPDTVYALLSTFAQAQEKTATKTSNAQTTEKYYKNLAPFVQKFVQSGQFNEQLFRYFTPPALRSLPGFKKHGTLHPNEVPEGLGNDYLTYIAGVMVYDSSIDPHLFKEAMHKINALWNEPWPPKRINALIKYELARPEWTYDQDWASKVDYIQTRYESICSIWYDPTAALYYLHDSVVGFSMWEAPDKLTKHLNTIAVTDRLLKTSDILQLAKPCQFVINPLLGPGELPPAYESDIQLDQYNLFETGKAYKVLLNPSDYSEYAGQPPKVTLAYFEHLIPDKTTRDYVLGFLHRKFKTLDFSSTILYFLGVSGSGKSMFGEWLKLFVKNEGPVQGDEFQLVTPVDAQIFLEKYNNWLKYPLFVLLDELSENLSSAKEAKSVVAKLKTYTGSNELQLRSMHSNASTSTHKCTFVLTANVNSLSLDLDDRRFVIIDTPNKFETADFVFELGGKYNARNLILDSEEQCRFAYWLAIEGPLLSKDEYTTPPLTATKQELIYKYLAPPVKFAEILSRAKNNMLCVLADENMMLEELGEYAEKSAVPKSFILELYEQACVGTNYNKSALEAALRERGVRVSRVRFHGSQQYSYIMPNLAKDYKQYLEAVIGTV